MSHFPTHATQQPIAGWNCRWTSGPDAGRRITLVAGHHWLGRSGSAPIRCDDAALEPHHALVMLDDDGGATIMQASGRVPIMVNGRPLEASVDLELPATITVGRSTLHLARDVHRPEPAAPDHPPKAAPVVLARQTRALPTWEDTVFERPELASPATDLPGGLLMAIVGLAVAVVMATAMRQPLILLLGGLGAVATIGTWIVSRVRARRHGQRARRTHAVALAQFEQATQGEAQRFADHLHRHTSTPCTAWDASLGGGLWSRRAEHADAFVVSVGAAELPWYPRLQQKTRDVGAVDTPLDTPIRLTDTPTTADLGEHARLGLRGDRTDALAVARSLLLQLATNCGPADVRFVIATSSADDWAWIAPAPHSNSGGRGLIVTCDEVPAAIAALDHPQRPHIVLVVDDTYALTVRTGPVRRSLADSSIALLALTDNDTPLPHLCTAQMQLGAGGGPMSARWFADATTSTLPQLVTTSGIGTATGLTIAQRLAGFADPEDPLGDGAAVPRTIGLCELLERTMPAGLAPESIAANWRERTGAPRTPLGLAADGVVDLDLVRDGPHGLLAGTTGAGKSELLRSLVLGLATCNSPEQLTFVLIDYKGGATFDACAALPHVVGLVTDLDDHLADRALRSLRAELRLREETLRRHGVSDLPGLREVAPAEVMPRLVVIIDEFAALVTEQPTFMSSLVDIAQRGRSLGVHLLLATQRPAGVISDEIRANTNLRVALRVHDSADALDVLGVTGPATIGRGLPGRAMMRLGPDEIVTFQTASCTVGDDQVRLVAAITAAAELSGIGPQRGPWRSELPYELHHDPTWLPDQVGIADDPDRQRHEPVRFAPDGGNLLIVGAPGMGATSALLSLADCDEIGRHLYVIDATASGAALRGLAEFDHCAAVVGVGEQERLSRLLHRLDNMRQLATGGVPVTLMIDGLDRLRVELDDPATAHDYEMLDRLLTSSSKTIRVIATTRRTSSLPTTVVCSFQRRWVLFLGGALDPDAVGTNCAAAVTSPIPGRILEVESGLQAQLITPHAFGADRRRHASATAGDALLAPLPIPIRCLPAVVSADLLPPAMEIDDAFHAPLGLAFTTDSPLAMEIPHGEHALVLGPSRSGKTMALRRLALAWRQANAQGRIIVVQPRGRHRPAARLLAEVAHHVCTDIEGLDGSDALASATLLIVDDAELVDDPSGVIAELIRRGRALVIAAAKPDALRQSYGHWTSVLRRSRLGLVAASGGELDGDLLGVLLPHRLPTPARPGLMWLVDNGEATLCQLALDDVSCDIAPRAHDGVHEGAHEGVPADAL
jgi:DNA segregation ATPase FtsK/SpoIIIE, S-DNA-T family